MKDSKTDVSSFGDKSGAPEHIFIAPLSVLLLFTFDVCSRALGDLEKETTARSAFVVSK